jgi:hypothetical protein
MQCRISRHHRLDAYDVIGVDGLLELAGFFEGLDISLKLRPVPKAVETRDFELRICDRYCRAGPEQVFGVAPLVDQSTQRPPFNESPGVRTSG